MEPILVNDKYLEKVIMKGKLTATHIFSELKGHLHEVLSFKENSDKFYGSTLISI